jgi:CubicO group peptidase (beta-lactamase class C family)
MRRLLLASLLLPAAAFAQHAGADSLFARLDAAPGPGLAVAVVKDGRVVLSKGYGLASLEHGVPITGSTVFDVASLSKQFAGLAVAMLVQEGKLDLDADIARYVPEMAPLTARHPVTIRQLVHHTSGLRDWPATLALAGWRMDDVISYDQILRFAFAQRSVNFAPGSAYTYSNTGYNLLAEAVARVSGMSFAAFTRDRVFRPLGMTRSHFQEDHSAIVPGRASGYGRQADGSFRVATDQLTALGSSSLFSSVEDLAKWLLNLDAATVGGPDVQALMRSRFTLTDGTTIPYAFGLSHGAHRGHATLAHSGSWAQFATYLVHFPSERLGVVVLANSGSISASRAAFDVADLFLTRTSAAAAPDVPLRTRPAVRVAPATLDAYAGLYRLGPGWYLDIRRAGDALTTRATNEGEFPMQPRSEREFWIDAYDGGLAFVRDVRGRVDTLLYRGIRAPRVDTATARRTLTSAELASLAGRYESPELATTYEVTVTGGALTVSHFRHGSAPLTWTWQEFTSPWWFMRSLTFERDASGRVTGMLVDSGERSRANRFVRRD